MSDEVDVAYEQEATYLSAALSRRNSSLTHIGQCHACSGPLAGSLRFCDTDCRDDWEREESARKRGGRHE